MSPGALTSWQFWALASAAFAALTAIFAKIGVENGAGAVLVGWKR